MREWLDEIVICSCVQTLNTIFNGRAGRKHENQRIVTHRPDSAADLQTVHLGQHPIQNHQVMGARSNEIKRSGSIMGGIYVVTLVHERTAQGLGDPKIVVNNQNASSLR